MESCSPALEDLPVLSLSLVLHLLGIQTVVIPGVRFYGGKDESRRCGQSIGL